jgi:basic amino acid/polyamine antiporter, APA family
MTNSNQKSEEKLQRNIGLAALAIYGIGDILGAGIYGLIGRAAGEMGNAVWLAFVTSMIAAGLTGLSYASLGSRYPQAGGASNFVHQAFNFKFVSYVVGLMTLASGITSMATGSRAFSGYFNKMINDALPFNLVVIGFCIFIAAVVMRGIRESMFVNIICTVIELGGLVLILITGSRFIGQVDYLNTVSAVNPAGDLGASMILSGAVLTFFSFVGFEDMINVAEEVKEPEKNLPRAILIAISVSSLVYMGISFIAVAVIPSAELAKSTAPLVDVAKITAPWFPSAAFGLIAIFAVANTALLNFIMGSRLIYGMANQKLLPSMLGQINARTKTPINASLVLFVIFLALALSGDISALARSTSTLLLSCFLLVNIGLVVLKVRKEKPGRFEVPMFVPILGAFVCLLMLAHTKVEELKVSGTILLIIIALYFIVRPSDKAIAKMDA